MSTPESRSLGQDLLTPGTVEATGTPKEIGAGIIRLLSEGTYTTFAQALKELVSNAFDAGAARVDIRTLNDCRDVVVWDDGHGMTQDEFRDNWARIVGGSKRGKQKGPSDKREPIGFMGVGTLAVARVCKEVRVVSRKRGTDGLFDARLDFESMLKEEKYSQPLSEVYKYDLLRRQMADATTDGFTYVILRGIGEEIRAELLKTGLTLADSLNSAAGQLSGMELLKWNMGLLCPVGYAGDGPVAGSNDPIVEWLRKQRTEDAFRVFLDGQEILRPVALPSHANLSRSTRDDATFRVWTAEQPKASTLKFKAYIVAQRYQVIPQELRGIQLRLRGIGIGGYRSDFFGVKVPSATVARSVSGEIYIEAGIDDALTLERTDVRRDHAGFKELRAWIESQVGLFSNWHYTQSKKRRRKPKPRSREPHRERMASVLTSFSSGLLASRGVTTRVVESGVTAPPTPIVISHDRQKITINRNHPVFAHFEKESAELELLEMFVFALQLGVERASSDTTQVVARTLEVLDRLLSVAADA